MQLAHGTWIAYLDFRRKRASHPHESETARVIESRNARWIDARVAGHDQNGCRFEYEIADRQNEPAPLVDDDSGSIALGAQGVRGARIFDRFDTQLDEC